MRWCDKFDDIKVGVINLIIAPSAIVGLMVATPVLRLYDKWKGPETEAEMLAAEHATIPLWLIPLGFVVISATLTGIIMLVGPLGAILLVVGGIGSVYLYAGYTNRE